MRVLGIDPGYERLGISIVETVDNSPKDSLVYSVCLQTSAKLPFVDRLHQLGKELEQIINEYQPEVLAIEKLYFTNNQKTAMNVSQIIGMLLFIARSNNLSIFEYTPMQIKVACGGNGRADKKQIMTMLPHLITINKNIKYDDEYDAIAAALTHLAHSK